MVSKSIRPGARGSISRLPSCITWRRTTIFPTGSRERSRTAAPCAGGESGYTAPDPVDAKIVFGGTVARCNVETGETRNVTPEVNLPAPARHTWTNPLVFSPADPHARSEEHTSELQS